jgi:hypothetical protein
VSADAKLRRELVGEDLGAATRERHLRAADGDPHPAIRPFRAVVPAM